RCSATAILSSRHCRYAKSCPEECTLYVYIVEELTKMFFKLDHFCEVLAKNDSKGESSDLFFGFRCFTMDTITAFCFARSVHALDAPNFVAPIIEAMEASLPTFVLFKHFPLFRTTIFSLP